MSMLGTEDKPPNSNLIQCNNQTKAESLIKPDSSGITCLSTKSWSSMHEPYNFKDGPSVKQIQGIQGGAEPLSPSVYTRVKWYTSEPTEVKGEEEIITPRPHRRRSEVIVDRLGLKHKNDLDAIFTILEESIMDFVRVELKKFRKVLDPEHSEKLGEAGEVKAGEEDEERSNREAFLKITLSFLRRIKQERLADALQRETLAVICQNRLKSNLRTNFQYVFEGIPKAGNPTLLNHIYTDLYITQGENREVNSQHEVRQIEAVSQRATSSETPIRCEDLFGLLPDRAKPVRTLLTMGVAGIGKTIFTQKYVLDWAEDKANKDIQFIFPFTFRELNLLPKKKFSLVGLLHHVFIETKEAGLRRLNKFKVVFIFDGLDECQLPLDFHKNEIVTDVTEPALVSVLLTNLIRGKLLPSAHVWITTRPAAANQIPPECIDMVTEVRGFTDPQKEEYFRKKFSDQEKADRIISHFQTSRNLHVMCYIPVFCWITAAVLEDLLKDRERQHLPKTLTEMYIYFLLVQTKQGNIKYHSNTIQDSVWNTDAKKTILFLGKLAFEQLEKGNLIFYETDLHEYGIDIKAASVYSGLFTEILKEEHRLSLTRVFCFVHLSIQEFLAALYVSLTFTNDGIDLLRGKQRTPVHRPYLTLLKRAVDKSLESPNGHLDLFVRFLLGLSLETNQMLLKGLLKKTGSSEHAKEMAAMHIKKIIGLNASPEKCINLFNCLNELSDLSLVEEMQQYLRSGSFSGNKLSPSQCSALAFILLSSQKDLDELDLRKFSASGEGLLRLLPVVKATKTSLLSGCNLSIQSCEALGSVLTSMNSTLRKLDLSDNDLGDTGVESLSNGLKSPHCRLEILGLSGCLITEKGCVSLAAALNFNPSHLKELDLSFNHPGELGLMLLYGGMNRRKWKLETLKVDHCGECRLKPSPLRYFCELSLDSFTADKQLLLSQGNKKVMLVKEPQLYLHHPDRFDTWKQLLCGSDLTDRCYWEVEWNGKVNIGVAYRGISGKGDGNDCRFGRNDKSWSLMCTPQGYTAWHNNIQTNMATRPTPHFNKVAVYLDWPAGTVTFYCIQSMESSVKHIHLHTFHSTFTEPLYPAFGFGQTLEQGTDSKLIPASVHLTQIDE